MKNLKSKILPLFLASMLLSPANLIAGIYETLAVWDKTEIKVCFYDEESQLEQTRYGNSKEEIGEQGFRPAFLKKRHKKRIKKVLDINYTREETGIIFTGLKNCSETNDYDVIVLRAKNKNKFIGKAIKFEAASTMGMAGIGDEHGFNEVETRNIPVVVFKDLQYADTIVHEFGHLAGLRHEHIRWAAKNDPNCKIYDLYGRLLADYSKTLEGIYKLTVVHTKYDPNSIMNKCFVNKLDDRDPRRTKIKIWLSVLDKQTLRHMYPN